MEREKPTMEGGWSWAHTVGLGIICLSVLICSLGRMGALPWQ